MRIIPLVALALLAGLMAGCETEVREMPEERVDVPGRDQPVAHTPPEPAVTSPDLVRDLARERREAAERAREHVREMRRLSADEWYAHRDAHVRETAAFLGVLERQFATLRERWGNRDPRIGEVMGVPGAEQHALVSEMAALRDDLEMLAQAPEWQVRDRMPQHIDRLETLAQVAARSARRAERDTE